MNYKIRRLKPNTDNRGTLVELLRSDEVGAFNQIYCATIKPGCSRGGHYHKERKEWFCIIQGEGIYKIRDIKTGQEVQLPIGANDYIQIELSPGNWHEIRNSGDSDLIFVSAISDLYDKMNSDTYKG